MADYLGEIVTKLSLDGTDLNSGLAEARREFDRLKATEGQLDADLKRGVIGSGQHAKRVSELRDATRQLASAMQDAYSRAGSSVDRLGKSFEAGGIRAQAFGRGVLEASRGLEDLTTGGALGVLNNIQTTFYSMAQAAGLSAKNVALASAGVGTFATVAYIAWQNADKLAALLAEEHTATEAEHMAALEKNTARTVEETRNLTRAKKEQANLEATLERKTKAQELTREAVGTAIAETGDDKATGGMKAKVAVEKMLTEQGVGDQLMPLESRKLKESEARLASLKDQMSRGMPGTMDADVAMQAAIKEESRIQARILELRGKIKVALEAEAGRTVEAAKVNPLGLATMAESRPDLFDPRLAKGLRAATPQAREEEAQEEQRQAVVDQEFDESLDAMKEGVKRRDQKRDAEVAALASRKAKPIGDELSGDVLGRIGAGETRDDIMKAMLPEVERRMGDVPLAKEASRKILRQILEKIYGDVAAEAGPGIGQEGAALGILDERKQAAESKAGREKAAAARREGGIARDPVTGQPLTEAEEFHLKKMDEGVRDFGKANVRAGTPQGRQQAFRGRALTQLQGLDDQIARARPDLNQQQVAQAAGMAYRLMGQGYNRQAAIGEVMLAIQRQTIQMLQLQAARQQGFMGSLGQLQQQMRAMSQMRNTMLVEPDPTTPEVTMAGFSENEQRIRHLEELVRDALERLDALADQVGQVAQAQNLMRMPVGYGRGPQSTISAVAATGGITAAPDANTLGQGNVILRKRDGAALTNGRTVLCYSNFTIAVPAGTRLEVAPDGLDYKLVAADHCPAAP